MSAGIDRFLGLTGRDGDEVAVFESNASIEAVELVLRDVKLDHDSAMLVANDERVRFERPQTVR